MSPSSAARHGSEGVRARNEPIEILGTRVASPAYMITRAFDRTEDGGAYSVLGAIAETACQLSGSPLFALMGDGNQELIATFAARGRQVVEARHEQNAVAM